jgi:nucleoside-diphosphate-sugar epimerase
MRAPTSDAELEERLTAPSPADVACLSEMPGDVIVLGASGKMGPSLVRRIRRAADAAGGARLIMAVARFPDAASRVAFDSEGVTAIPADLSDPSQVDRLPDAPYVLFLVGRKFGTGDQAHVTWATNTLVPPLALRRYAASRVVVLSTGNVYPFVRPEGGGSRETDPLAPVGEYAQSCLGRERIAEHCSRVNGTRMLLVRLNYATDLRYGVLVDVARRVREGEPIDLSVAYVNTIWQGDANSYVLRGLAHCTSPPTALNVTGPDVLRVEDVAERFGAAFGRRPQFVGRADGPALLSNPERAMRLMGRPAVSADELIDWTAEWIGRGGQLLNKPTSYELTSGQF